MEYECLDVWFEPREDGGTDLYLEVEASDDMPEWVFVKLGDSNNPVTFKRDRKLRGRQLYKFDEARQRQGAEEVKLLGPYYRRPRGD